MPKGIVLINGKNTSKWGVFFVCCANVVQKNKKAHYTAL
jgi:hypothetical protein